VIERRDVIGFATRNEISVNDHFPIDPFSPGILQIALE
jgi:3-hydroxymyristoyl/3-hydroxydecanoyl-(acyl carrier protein) dehydratase